MLEFIKSLGGDVDTISSMAGALWGAAQGASYLPTTKIEQRALIIQTAKELFQLSKANAAKGIPIS